MSNYHHHHQETDNNNLHNKESVDIMESAPMFHSATMMMMSSRHPDEVLTTTTPFHHSVGLKQTAPFHPTTSKVSATAANRSKASGGDNNSDNDSSAVWNVATAALIGVPAFYKLERTNVRISSTDNVTLDQVTKRIVDSIRNESIAAVYDNREAKVTGETKCNVKFVLRLWSADNATIIVECQRESGCSFTFCEVAKKILKAAKTGVIKKKKKNKNKTKSDIDSIVPVEDPASLVHDSLSIVRDRFNSDRVDYHLLAMEALAHLSASPHCRVDCSRAIIIGADAGYADILEIIISLIICSRLPGSAHKDMPNETLAIETEHYDSMNRLALTVLANCLSALEECGELGSVLSSSSDSSMMSKLVNTTPSSDLLNALVLTVASSASKPHEASDAYKCLEMIGLRSESAKERIGELGGSLCRIDLASPKFY